MLYGWITSSGDVLSTRELYKHMDLLTSNAEFVQTFPEFATPEKIQEYQDDIRHEAQQSWSSQLGPDEHPAWHAFNDDCGKDSFYSLVYGAGFIRFGTYINSRQELVVELESSVAQLASDKKESLLNHLAKLELFPTEGVISTRSTYSKDVKFRF